MIADFIRRYKQILVLVVASVAIATYAIPFNSGSVLQTQAQSSLYEDLNDLLDADQQRTNERLDEVIEANPGQEDRVEDRRALSDERYDIAREHVADRTGGSGQNNLETNTEESNTEESNTEQSNTEQSNTEQSNTEDGGDSGNGNTNADNGRSDRTSNR